MREHLGFGKSEATSRAVDLLAQVRVPDPERSVHAFPHQFSGGMRQRVAIASALACEPRILVADEPTTALDVTVQAGILRLLDRLRRERGLSIIFITHDLGAMSAIADRITVFYAGRVIESGPTSQVFGHPRHPYTHGLLRALPHPEAGHADALQPIPGSAPVPQQIPSGCALHPRCAYAVDQCSVDVPAREELEHDARTLACHVDPFRDARDAISPPTVGHRS
jgi:oligopeptide/dipeptide ABC transporter ATP-binding protein